MNGWDNWKKEDQGSGLGDAGLSFLNNEPKTLDEVAPREAERECRDSSQCGSGYHCVKGYCISDNGISGGSTLAPSFPGTTTPTPPPQGGPSAGVPTQGSPASAPGVVYPPRGSGRPARGGSGAGSGSVSGCGNDPYLGAGNNTFSPCDPNVANTGCNKTGCGPDPGRAEDCCGEDRCCRYSGGSVRCQCGQCPPPEKQCNVWCDITKSATGDLWPGCDEDSICDECTECDGSLCAPKTSGAPCHCEEGSCNVLACSTCGDDGVCRQDCDNCMTVWQRSYKCPCGTVLQTCRRSACDPGLTHCTVPDCDDVCQDEPDPCQGRCYTQTFCDSAAPPCPAGSSCTDNGNISAGGSNCSIRTVCDKSNLPAECEECDCNCEDDCPDCKICNASGECVDDPECEGQYFVEYAWYMLDYEVQWLDSAGCEGAETIYDGGHIIAGANRGILLQDPLGTAWSVTSDRNCPTCESCPTAGQATGRNSSGYVQYPDGSRGGVVELGRCSCTGGFGASRPRNVYFRVGITVGVGNSPQAAECDAKSKNPKLNIYPSC